MNPCKRKFPRVDADIPIKYEVIKWTETSHHPEKALEAKCHDLSVRGIRLEHSLELSDKIIKKLREGTLKLNLEFKLPNVEEPINLLGRVIYCDEEEENGGEEEADSKCMGILFIDIEPEDYLKISQYIQSKLPS